MRTRHATTLGLLAALFLAPVACLAAPADTQACVVASEGAWTFTSQYASLRVDAKGFVTSIKANATKKEYSPAKHPSPLLSLHENGQPDETLLAPVAAAFDAAKKEIALTYPNGAVAVVKAEAKDAYFRFQLVSLTPRGKVDVIVWGPVNTTINKTLGDIIGVVRDDDFAIGLYGLDDNTLTGAVVDGAGRGMSYEAHSPDPEKFPLPADIKEGQKFRIGGGGSNDVAYFSKPEEYFRWVMGTGADLKPEFGSSIAYHSRDRQRSYTYFTSLLPGFENFGNRHMISDPLPGVDFIGSGVALYACPDDQGLKTLEKIILAEGLPYITIHGKWIRDPASFSPTVYWMGSVDKAIEYTKALGIKDLSRDTGEFYPNLALMGRHAVGKVGFSDGKTIPFQDFTAEAHKHGLTHGGLHTLCMFWQSGKEGNPSLPSEHLQTVCRTKLAKDVSPTDTEIEVTEPSLLAERGTWPRGKDSNYLRIGGEMLYLESISDSAPWILKVRRGHASKALAHKAGDELVKLMQNCYNGFVPDMTKLPEFAEYYADLMHRNGMDTINFDGFESAMYQQQGYYGVRKFCRILFETYHKLTGKYPRVTASCVFGGSWEYLNVCDLGGGSHMFNPRTGRRATEGKDIGNAFSASWFPATFGIQGWDGSWSVYDAQNLQAKAIGWEATYAFKFSQKEADLSGERDAIFTTFSAWQKAREAQVFTKAQKEKLRDPDLKFNLTQTDATHFLLQTVRELKASGVPTAAAAGQVAIANPYDAQPMQFDLCVTGPVDGCSITLPDGGQIESEHKMEKGQFIICKGSEAYVADKFRKKIADLKLAKPAVLPKGEAKVSAQYAGKSKPRFDLTVWALDQGETIGK